MTWKAIAVFILLILTNISLVTIISQTNEAAGKQCIDSGASNETVLSCRFDESNGFTSSLPQTTDNFKGTNNGGDDSMSLTNSEHRDFPDGGNSKNHTPFILPFP
ncbi:MAG TPA: hypothetical protein VH796_18230 [Nitrososphaeraceae archaeon]